MAADNSVTIVIAARDEATKTLQNVQKAAAETGRATVGTLTDMRGGFDALQGTLDKVGAVIPRLTGSFQGLSGIMTGSVGGAVTGLVSAFVSYGIALNRVSDEQARFQRVLGSLDAGKIAGELARINAEMDTMADLGNRIGNQAGTWTGALQSFLSRLQAIPQAAREMFLGAQTPESQKDQAKTILGGILGAQEGAKQTGIQAEIAGIQQRALLFEQQRYAYQGYLREFEALQPLLDRADQAEEALAVRALKQQQGLRRSAAITREEPLGPLEQTFELEEQALRGRLGIDMRGRKIAREQQRNALRERLFLADIPQYDEGAAYGITQDQLDAASFAAQERAFSGRAAGAEPGIDEAGRFESLAAGITPEMAAARKSITDADQQGRERVLQTTRELLSIEEQRNELLGQAPGLTRAEQEAISLQVSARREDLQLQQLSLELSQAASQEERNLITSRQQLVRETESLRRAQVEMQQRERTDPLAGANRFLRDQEDASKNLGDMMYRAGQAGAAGLQSGLGNALGDWILQQGNKGADLGKTLANSFVRAFTNELAGLAVSSSLGALRSLLGGVTGSPTARTVAGVGAGGGGGGLLGALWGPGQAAAGGGGGGAGTEAIFTGGRYFSATDVGIAQAQAGPAGVQALTSGQAVVSGDQLIFANSPDQGLVAGAAGGGMASAGSGFTFAQGAGIAASGAALGLSLYGAYQGTTSNQAVAINSALGAVQGAALGYQVGGAFGYGGYGAAIGAIVGAAASLGASLAGKAKSDREAKQAREASEAARAIAGAGDLVREAEAAQTMQAFHAALSARGPQQQLFPTVLTSVQTPRGARHVGTPDVGYDVATVDELFKYLDSLQAAVQQGVAPELLAPANQAATAALIARGHQLLDDYQSQIGQVEVFAESQMGNLARRTSVPASRADVLTGRDLFVSQVGLSNLAPETREQLLRSLVQLDQDLDLKYFTKDEETQDIRSITTLIPGPAPAPGPGAPGAGPAPVGGLSPGANLPAFSFQPYGGLDLPRRPDPVEYSAGPDDIRLDYQGQQLWDEQYGAALAAYPAQRSAAARAQLQGFFSTLNPAQFIEALGTPTPDLQRAVQDLSIADRQALGVSLVNQGLQSDYLAAFGASTGPGAGPGSGNNTGQAGAVAAAIGGELNAAISAGLAAITSVSVPGLGSIGLGGISGPSSGQASGASIGAAVGNAIGSVAGFFAGIPGVGVVTAAIGAAIGQGISNNMVDIAVNAATAQGVPAGAGLGIGLGTTAAEQAELNAAVAAAVAAIALDSGVTAGGSSTAGASGPTALGGGPGSGGPPGDVGTSPSAGGGESVDAP